MAPSGVWASAFWAGDKAPYRVTTSVPSLRTTVTHLGAWPVSRFSNALAARAIFWAVVGSDVVIGCILSGRRSAGRRRPKKAGGAEHLMVGHAGLLVDESPGGTGLPFPQSSNAL